jgi:hypothetical protein
VAEITPEQVHNLLTGTHEYLASAEAATKARDQLGHTLLNVVRQAKVSIKDLTAVTGLHPSTIRAAIRRAVGPGLPDGWEQPELEFSQRSEAIRAVRDQPFATVPTTPSAALAL